MHSYQHRGWLRRKLVDHFLVTKLQGIPECKIYRCFLPSR